MSPPVRRQRGGNQRRDPARRCRPVEEWPPSHRAAWHMASRPGDRLHPGGPASRWAPRSLAKTEKGYGRFLTWWDLQGKLDATASPGIGVTQALVAGYIDDLLALGNSTHTAICRVEELYDALRVMAPETTWHWLNQFVAQLRDEIVPSPRRQAQLQHADTLFDLGVTLMAQAEAAAGLTLLQQATMFRDGVIIALLAARPIRIGNLVGMRIGRNFIGDGATYKIMLRGKETKNRRHLEHDVPAALVRQINRYLDHYRPVLMSCGGRYAPAELDALWISREGGPLAEGSLRDAVKDRTRAAFSVAISPHRFRDASATDFAERDPKHLLAAAAVLGNNPTTMLKHYNKSQGRRAHQRYHAAIADLRGKDPGRPE